MSLVVATHALAGLKEVENLISQQRFQEAATQLAPLVEEAIKSGRDRDYAKLLLKKTMLEMALHGYEKAIKGLHEAQWPKEALSHAMISIIYSRTLKMYHDAYSWEIQKRERIQGGDKFDLKALTSEEIYKEAYKAFEKAWNLREKLGDFPKDKLEDIIKPNTFPKGIRATLRDSVSFLLVDLLNDSSGWRPEEANETYLLKLEELISGQLKVKNISNSTSHPLQKISFVLHDLEKWHLAKGNKDAALDARLELFRVLKDHFSTSAAKKELIEELKSFIETKKNVPWVTMGYGLLAELIQNNSDPDAKIRALSFAYQGAKMFPSTPGAMKCKKIIQEIERPSFNLEGMNIDGQNRETIGVNYRNLRKLYFRSVKVDFEEFIKTSKDYTLRLGLRQIKDILKEKPVNSWTIDLPETKDYRDHMQLIKPPKHSNGFYVILASPGPSFDNEGIRGIQLFFGPVSFSVSQDFERAEMTVEVSNGENGAKVSEAEVQLFIADHQTGHQKVETLSTNKFGQATFRMKIIPRLASFFLNRGMNHFFIVKYKGDVIGSKSPSWMYAVPKREQGVKEAFIYTDRSIFRPEQKILWKVIAYEGAEKKFKVNPEKDLNVYLRDANDQLIQTVKTRTNSFGSVSGEFVIPKGRMLGNWNIQTDHGGYASIKVEEYKRPKFLLEIEKKGLEMRFNKEARLKGFAKYYFGMPLTSGSAKWTIKRKLILPWWCFWGRWNWGETQETSLVSSGSSKVSQDGSFEVKFTPKADEALADNLQEMRYSYEVNIDVTDEGGETQSISYTTTIGFLSIAGSIAFDQNFYLENDRPQITIHRSDLSGKPLPGIGSWKLFKLIQPRTTLLPAEIPAPKELLKLGEKSYKHPDDLKQLRWSTTYNPAFYLRDWPEGDLIKTGDLSFAEDGKAKIGELKLKEGAYRLVFETKDSFGSEFKTQKEFLVIGKSTIINLPGFFAVQKNSSEVGEKIRVVALTGFRDQQMILEIFKGGSLKKRIDLVAGKDGNVVEFPVTEEDRGGLDFTLRFVRDYQDLQFSSSVIVPWSNKDIDVSFSTLREKMRPGSKETLAVTIKGKNGRKLSFESFELLSYMYDQSLEAFTQHSPPNPLAIYPMITTHKFPTSELGTGVIVASGSIYNFSPNYFSDFSRDYFNFYPSYGIGGPGSRGVRGILFKGIPGGSVSANLALESVDSLQERSGEKDKEVSKNMNSSNSLSIDNKPIEVRSNFSENGFWKPHLVPGKDGSVKFEFTVPDSVTSWKVWAHAVSKDLQTGNVSSEVKTIKELMVRPYLPRFFREGDEASIKIVISNSSDKSLSGHIDFDILDESQKTSLLKEFGVTGNKFSYDVKAGGSSNVLVKLKAPIGPRMVVVKVIAKSANLSDGEVHPMPLLPGRIHLGQSRFITLKNKDRKALTFPDLVQNNDPTLVNDLFVVTLDAQLFYSVLSSLPYLVNYPYQTTDAMMDSFVSTGILSSVFNEFPEVSKMAEKFSSRKSFFEKWGDDSNRKIALEEAPWLSLSKGGVNSDDLDMISVLHPDIAKNTKNRILRELKSAQTTGGGFPWFPGGPPSPFQTLSLLYGFSKAMEFNVEVPKDMIVKAWAYMHEHYVTDIVNTLIAHDAGWEFVTFLNYVLSNYPDQSWSGNAFSENERKLMLDFSFKHWKKHSPYLKGYLATTLMKAKREEDAKLVWNSVMDSAKTSEDEGTHWAQEERTWLWYNDTVQTHAMALRVGSELKTAKDLLDGLVHWIFLNKKLNHWKSTRATSEVIYSLTHYLKKTKQLGVKEKIEINMGGQNYKFDFNPSEYTGKRNQILIPAKDVSSKLMPVTVHKHTEGLAFASATWHYSTEKLPKEAVGDFFKVSRKYFKRSADKKNMILRPLEEGETVAIGDEVEVQISLTTKHPAEYVHLKDPRAAGFEPLDSVSQHKWDLSIFWYEEIRDSGTNFFFENLPQGQYTFKYRLRATTAGKYRAGPATIQPLYAPEFIGHSQGHELIIE